MDTYKECVINAIKKEMGTDESLIIKENMTQEQREEVIGKIAEKMYNIIPNAIWEEGRDTGRNEGYSGGYYDALHKSINAIEKLIGAEE